jgi:toxin ParE1/3/4
MGRFRLSSEARVDLASILATSLERWGREGERRYAATLSAAMRQVADNPTDRASRDRADLWSGVRSFHICYTRVDRPAARVKGPVHILYYRVIHQGMIEIIRVLHERMEPKRHLGADPD